MARPWISLLLLSLVLVVIEGVRNPQNIDPCPEKNVCVIFGNYGENVCIPEEDNRYIIIGGNLPGTVWENYATCPVNHKSLYVSLWIEPLSARKWKFVVTGRQDSVFTVNEFPTVRKHIQKYAFDFGNAKIKWLFNGTEPSLHKQYQMEFSYYKDDKWQTSLFLASAIESFAFSEFNYARYQAIVESEDEDLITLFATDVIKLQVLNEPGTNGELNDPKFNERLQELTPCDPSELNDACKGGSCKKIYFKKGIVDCSSNLWYHSAADDGMFEQWKPLDSIKCYMGKWHGNYTEWSKLPDKEEEIAETDSTEEDDEEETGDGTGDGTGEGTTASTGDGNAARRRRDDQPEMSTSASTEGNSTDSDSIAGESQIVDLSSKKVQCAADRPSAMTSKASMLIGIGGAFLALGIIAAIAVVVFIVLRRKRNAEPKNTFRDSDSKAQTPKESKKSTRTGSVAEVGGMSPAFTPK